MFDLNKKPIIFAGPCALETQESALAIAKRLKELKTDVFRAGVWKGQNRPVVKGKPCYWGFGDTGVYYLKEIGKELNIPVVTEVQSERHLEIALDNDLDIIQVGARHMQNFPLIRKLSKVNKPIILKRGLANTIDEWLGIAEHLSVNGNHNIILCERGIVSFERSSEIRWRLDVLAIPQIKYDYPQYKIIADVSHGVGRREFVIPMAKAALAAGADGLMVEVHSNPEESRTDARQTISLDTFAELMRQI
jgi:3-deoxy-7-phosphoheptulonate synthase